MMEFTYDGMVRYGFGFYNPNHAAALICALLPFLWGWRRLAWLGWGLTLLGCVALALTFSRTGVLVLLLEFGMYFGFRKDRNWKLFLLLLGGIFFILLAVGVLARFQMDRAIGNRPQIWLAGLKIYAANPWGVGVGNSGLVASHFLLDGIECRTLVNSHLTLLAECGILWGWIWVTVIIYALLNGRRHLRAWCAWAGLVVSAASASVFDWDLLRDLRNFGGLPWHNFLLSWLLLGTFLGLAVLLCWGKWRMRIGLTAIGTGLLVVLLPLGIKCNTVPVIRHGIAFSRTGEQKLALYDEAWDVKSVLPWLHDGYAIPLRPGYQQCEAEQVWLFGYASEFAPLFPQSRLIFVEPPEFCQFPSNTAKVLSRYGTEQTR